MDQGRMTSGALAGFGATIPMTMSMALLKRFPERDPTPIPPKRVAREMVRKVDVAPSPKGLKQAIFTYTTHFGFGAAAGVLYALVVRRPENHPAWKGLGFGLGVWATSYMGWIPALGILPSPSHETKQHLASQVLSHVVWGTVLGTISASLTSQKKKAHT